MKTLPVLICVLAASSNAMELKSPDGRLLLTFDVKGGVPVYSVARDGKPIIAESRLGLEIEQTR